MSGRYSTPEWRKLKASFRHQCELSRAPCARCKAPIDYQLKHPDPWAFQADHIQPGSTHPHLFFIRSNLRPLHARCNWSRRADPIEETDSWVVPPW